VVYFSPLNIVLSPVAVVLVARPQPESGARLLVTQMPWFTIFFLGREMFPTFSPGPSRTLAVSPLSGKQLRSFSARAHFYPPKMYQGPSHVDCPRGQTLFTIVTGVMCDRWYVLGLRRCSRRQSSSRCDVSRSPMPLEFSYKFSRFAMSLDQFQVHHVVGSPVRSR